MYNLAKISNKRNAPLNRNLLNLSINIAMHYIYLQLISVLIYYTYEIKIDQKTKTFHMLELLHTLTMFSFSCVF